MTFLQVEFTGTQALPIVVAIIAPIISWILADARSKARALFMEERVATLKQDSQREMDNGGLRLNTLEIKLARSEQDRIEIHKSVERIDTQKASKEVVDGFRSEIATLRQDIDKRFDKLERILEGKS